MKKVSLLFLVVILMTLVATGCSPEKPTDDSEDEGQPVPVNVTCEVYYRRLDDPKIKDSQVLELVGESDQAEATFDDMAFSAQFSDDPYEGRSLSILVTSFPDNREIARHLYQMLRTKVPANDFIGGHGFTGLAYIFHPVSSGEVQYFCSAKSEPLTTS